MSFQLKFSILGSSTIPALTLLLTEAGSEKLGHVILPALSIGPASTSPRNVSPVELTLPLGIQQFFLRAYF